MARATLRVAATAMMPTVFGRRWRSMIRPPEAPSARAPWTNSRSRRASICPRTMRVTSQLVGAEHMPFGERRRELVRHLDPDRIGQTQAPGEDGAEPEEGDDEHAADGGTMADEARQNRRVAHARRTRGSTAA